MLGLGLLVVNTRLKNMPVKMLIAPGKYQPRISKHRQQWLMDEFKQRKGDPNSGGMSTKAGIVTAYRQQAISIAQFLMLQGPSKASDIARTLEITKARDILYKNYYDWFERKDRGIYALSEKGLNETSSGAHEH